ncbi:hypothetical protein PV327_004536 [Microctonus hyperodae]|uniref:Uncharacterized protein n=1 Tax=Microctonus hyperodae TaxID=165561 RepID=A0AA39KML9_MICHY|nr:hypothetical protein PV327_004536 [Microctonus hyperodae]
MLSRRACSESGVHPDVNVVNATGSWLNDCVGSGSVSGNSGGGHGHLWGKRQRGQTSGFVLGHANSCTTQPIILRTRRSWPVAPIQCRRASTTGGSGGGDDDDDDDDGGGGGRIVKVGDGIKANEEGDFEMVEKMGAFDQLSYNRLLEQ